MPTRMPIGTATTLAMRDQQRGADDRVGDAAAALSEGDGSLWMKKSRLIALTPLISTETITIASTATAISAASVASASMPRLIELAPAQAGAAREQRVRRARSGADAHTPASRCCRGARRDVRGCRRRRVVLRLTISRAIVLAISASTSRIAAR